MMSKGVQGTDDEVNPSLLPQIRIPATYCFGVKKHNIPAQLHTQALLSVVFIFLHFVTGEGGYATDRSETFSQSPL
jgi:hypothetical protein